MPETWNMREYASGFAADIGLSGRQRLTCVQVATGDLGTSGLSNEVVSKWR